MHHEIGSTSKVHVLCCVPNVAISGEGAKPDGSWQSSIPDNALQWLVNFTLARQHLLIQKVHDDLLSLGRGVTIAPVLSDCILVTRPPPVLGRLFLLLIAVAKPLWPKSQLAGVRFSCPLASASPNYAFPFNAACPLAFLECGNTWCRYVVNWHSR